MTTSEQTVNKHLNAFGRGDVDALMEDYAESAVFYTPDGALRGKAQIRPLLERLVATLPPGSAIEVQQRIVDGPVAYLVWSGESTTMRIPFATDTLFVQDGKILRQTFAAQVQFKQAPPA
jgi:ketosteroid isomerase-like protein